LRSTTRTSTFAGCIRRCASRPQWRRESQIMCGLLRKWCGFWKHGQFWMDSYNSHESVRMLEKKLTASQRDLLFGQCFLGLGARPPPRIQECRFRFQPKDAKQRAGSPDRVSIARERLCQKCSHREPPRGQKKVPATF
jgi:hypothetical protein